MTDISEFEVPIHLLDTIVENVNNQEKLLSYKNKNDSRIEGAWLC